MLTCGKIKRVRQSQICASEVIYIAAMVSFNGSRNFKAFYLYWAKPFLSGYFPNLPSYSRFIELKAKYVMYFVALVESLKSLISRNCFCGFHETCCMPQQTDLSTSYLPIVQLGEKLLSTGFMVLRFI